MVHRSQVTFLRRDDARTTLLNEIAEKRLFSDFRCTAKISTTLSEYSMQRLILPPKAGANWCEMKDFLMPPRFVHASTHINRILLDMQREHAHMAVVVDDYGGVIGIITLEDILEELVERYGTKATK